MDKSADLHIHTHFSDSTDSPESVVQKALEINLSCIAIADHDTIDGINPTIYAAKDHPLEVIPAIELSTELDNKDIHILGYLFDCNDPALIQHLKKIQISRMDRMKKMLEKLKELGIDNITLEEVCELNKSDAIGRPHLAQKLIEKGWVANAREAFAKYLGEGCPAFITKFKQTPSEGIKLIHEYGGVAVLAHPMMNRKDEIISHLVEAGLDGIEVYYPNIPPNIIKYYESIAQKNGLLMTGGSDAHGDAKKNTFIGKVRVPYELVEALKNKKK